MFPGLATWFHSVCSAHELISPCCPSVRLVNDTLASIILCIDISEPGCLSGFVMENSQQSTDGTDRSDLVSADGKNIKSVLCQRCGSKVLCPGMATLEEKEVRCETSGTSCQCAAF